MASKSEVRFDETKSEDRADSPSSQTDVDDSESEAPAGGECPLEETDGDHKELQIPPPPIKRPAVISCHLLLDLIDDATTMLWTLALVSEDLVLCEDPSIDEGAALDGPIYPTLDKLEKEQLQKVPELVERLKLHADRKKFWKEAEEEDIPNAKMLLTTSAWLLCCHFLTNEYSRDQLEQLGLMQHPVFLYMCELLGKIRPLAVTRFSTSLEEGQAIEGYRSEIFKREERAIKDSDTVAGYLRADRKKRANDLAQYLENEHLIHQDKENSKLQAIEFEKQLVADCATLEAQEFSVFNVEYSKLENENKSMGDAFWELQNKDRDKELQMRGKKGQSIEEVADLLWEYENDITTKQDTLNGIIVQHAAIAQNLEKMQIYFAEKAHLAAIKAEEERVYREANVAKRRSKWLPYYAALRIQRYWKRFKQRKADVEKAAQKGKKGKKGGKKGGKRKKKKK